MIDTKLILLEGLPGTGKTTNSSFIFNHLQYNGVNTRWIHEVTRFHPTSYYHEASLRIREYDIFVMRFPHTKQILEKVAIRRENSVSIDLLELKWNYIDNIGAEAFDELNKYDVWKFSIDRYEEVALEKWESFTRDVLKGVNQVTVLDSSIFQFQIFTFLLQNTSYERLEGFIQKLFQIISPLKPVLIYLYREKTAESIAYLEKDRGIQFLECIWERDKEEPFYKNRPRGAEGYKQFLLCYGRWADSLFNAASCDKISLEISNGQWNKYEEEMLSFIDIQKLAPPKTKLYKGIFRNDRLDMQLEINELTLIDSCGVVRKLIPKSENEFFVDCLPVILRFIKEDKIILEGDQILEQWTTSGIIYTRI